MRPVVLGELEGHRGLLARGDVHDREDLGLQSLQLGRAMGHRVGSLHRGVPVVAAHRLVARGALAVVGLGSGRVILAGGEVDVVVTGLAGRPAGERVPGGRLRRRSGMAGGAVANVPWEGDFGEVRLFPELVGGAGLDAREVLAHVDLVDQDLEVRGLAVVRIDRLGLVAEDAELHVVARTAVRGQRVVASVAGGVRELVPDRVGVEPLGTKSCSTS